MIIIILAKVKKFSVMQKKTRLKQVWLKPSKEGERKNTSLRPENLKT